MSRRVGRMQSIVKEINEWFLPRREHIEMFAQKCDVRVDEWFKAEMLALLGLLKCGLVIDDFEIDCRVGSGKNVRKVDFKVIIEETPYYCLVRSTPVGRSRKRDWLKKYLRRGRSGMAADIRKLEALGRKDAGKCLLAFVYPRPTQADWNAAVADLGDDIGQWRCVTNLGSSPQHLFIAMWCR